ISSSKCWARSSSALRVPAFARGLRGPGACPSRPLPRVPFMEIPHREFSSSLGVSHEMLRVTTCVSSSSFLGEFTNCFVYKAVKINAGFARLKKLLDLTTLDQSFSPGWSIRRQVSLLNQLPKKSLAVPVIPLKVFRGDPDRCGNGRVHTGSFTHPCD